MNVTLSVFSKFNVVVTRSAVPNVNVDSAATKKPSAGIVCPFSDVTLSMTPEPAVAAPSPSDDERVAVERRSRGVPMQLEVLVVVGRPVDRSALR